MCARLCVCVCVWVGGWAGVFLPYAASHFKCGKHKYIFFGRRNAEIDIKKKWTYRSRHRDTTVPSYKYHDNTMINCQTQRHSHNTMTASYRPLSQHHDNVIHSHNTMITSYRPRNTKIDVETDKQWTCAGKRKRLMCLCVCVCMCV
jgi:hypothetical protein